MFRSEAVDASRLFQIRDEVLDVGRPDFCDRPITEPLDRRLQPVVDRGRKREAFRQDVLFVHLRELRERQRRPSSSRGFQEPASGFA